MRFLISTVLFSLVFSSAYAACDTKKRWRPAVKISYALIAEVKKEFDANAPVESWQDALSSFNGKLEESRMYPPCKIYFTSLSTQAFKILNDNNAVETWQEGLNTLKQVIAATNQVIEGRGR